MKQGRGSLVLLTAVVAAFAMFSIAISPSAHAAQWSCSAKNMLSGSYSGGSKARIHLKGYGRGGSYSVKKVSANKVTGVTQDGTPYTCVKK
jgi:hypothetical protein